MAVIIPFYQRERGILPVAVNSVLAQSEKNLVVIVVDDGSPIPARDELASIMAQDNRVTIIERTNGGPGAARNSGLDAVPGGTAAIAFLDSDDRWTPDHLANGLIALDHGADLYFSDSDHSGRGLGASQFAKCGITPSCGERVQAHEDLYFYKGNVFDLVIPCAAIATPAVVLRRCMAVSARFSEELVAGEDRLFWMQLLNRTKNVMFSCKNEVECGRGVNISLSSKWGTAATLRRLLDTVKAFRMMEVDLPLSPAQRSEVSKLITIGRREFASTLLHLLRHPQEIDWRVVRAYFHTDPLLVPVLVATVVKVAHRKSLSRS